MSGGVDLDLELVSAEDGPVGPAGPAQTDPLRSAGPKTLDDDVKSRTLEQQNVHKEDNWRTSGDEEHQAASSEQLTGPAAPACPPWRCWRSGFFSRTSRFTLELRQISDLRSPRTRARAHKRTKQTP